MVFNSLTFIVFFVVVLLLHRLPLSWTTKKLNWLPASLIVLGSHGHSAVYDLPVGSVSEGIVRASGIPVLLVPAKQ